MISTAQYALIFAVLLTAVLCVVVVMRSRMQTNKYAARRKNVVNRILEQAQEQNESLDIKMLDDETGKNGLAATLQHMRNDGIEVDVLSYVPRDWEQTWVDVYFRVTQNNRISFYKFRSKIVSVKAQGNRSIIVLARPEDLEVGQKRNFIRIRPPKETVRVIGLWHLDPGKPVPKDTSEIGAPVIHYKLGMKNEPVQVENISATGLGLRFPMEAPDVNPVNLDKGSHLLCLVIYNLDAKEDQVVTFWCTCEVVNARVLADSENVLVLGTQFTNWSVLEPGKSEIHWFNCSPTKGVAPITQWVMHMDKKQRKFM
ncbi:MAG: hypothetical protein LBB60_05165 [Desulfovibrio sp.]|nr:hypothetical protein [Desulfovibrio sp.]